MAQAARSARAAGKVSFAVFVSRILGLVRDQVFAKLFGAGLYNDAWLVAFRIPNLLRDLFAEGALSAAFVPTFTDFLHKKGRPEAWVLANLVLSALLILLGGFALALSIFSESFVYLLAAGFADVPGKVEITADLLKVLSPFLMLIALASVGMAILNTLNHFFIPALAPALFNVALIAAGIFLVPQFDNWGILPIHAMGVGALVGGLLQYGMQLPLMRQHGYRFRFRIDLAHEGVRKIARLIAPAIVGVLVELRFSDYLFTHRSVRSCGGCGQSPGRLTPGHSGKVGGTQGDGGQFH
jgi:putative peptidoglycan lipid II flippase